MGRLSSKFHKIEYESVLKLTPKHPEIFVLVFPV